ncbi:hypothetical protein GGI12_004100, partial [Dipsacomyces acuminosporus]
FMIVYRAIDALKSQLDRAKNDMDILMQLREQAMANPLAYIESIMANTAPKAPSQQAVVEVPQVYIEPYLICADQEAIVAYMSCIRASNPDRQAVHSVAGTSGRNTPTSAPGTLRSIPIRQSSFSARQAGSGRSGGRALHQFSSATWARSTGHTAVPTPESSPTRLSDRPLIMSLPAGNPALLDTGAADSSMNGLSQKPEGSVEGANLWTSQTPLQIPRANTEPLRDTNTGSRSASANGAAAGTDDSVQPDLPSATEASAKHGIRTSVTQPGTPTHRGRSQKTLTPQILAEFRRQVSEERSQSPQRHGMSSDVEYNDDDGFVNSAPATVNPWSRQADSTIPFTGPRPSGKGILAFNPKTPKTPKRGRPPGSNGTQKHSKSRAKTKGTRGPTRYDDDKPRPASFNLPWSDEEQERLEELLLIYPEEPVANDRWRKISDALGTRTMRQVASRVQKYFIKLARAGLPVPGRVPDTSNWTSIGGGRNAAAAATATAATAARPAKGDSQPKRRRGGFSGSPSAGRRKRKYVDFTSSEEDDELEVDLDGFSDNNESSVNHDAMVYDRKGKQADRASAPHGFMDHSSFDTNASEDHGDSMATSFDVGTLLDAPYAYNGESSKGGAAAATASSSRAANGSYKLQGQAAASSAAPLHEQAPALQSSKAVHLGYRCDSCLAEPIVGIRWHCLDCHGAQAVDLCDECREEGAFETPWHKVTHNFHAKRDAEMEPYYASEVAATALREYSYLA